MSLRLSPLCGLNNDKMPEPSTFNTVLNFVCAVFHFMYAYDNEPHKLFHHCYLWDWMLCAIRECDMKYKFMFMYKAQSAAGGALDDNIPSTMERKPRRGYPEARSAERFFNIDDKEIYRLLALNFSQK